MVKDYTFVNRAEYFRTLASLAREAQPGERVMVAAMGFDPTEPLIHDLLEALKAVAHHGVKVTLLIDAINFLSDSRGVPGPLFYGTSLGHARGIFAATKQALDDLAAAGAQAHITNIPTRRFNPAPIGRSHIKGAVVGDQLFVGGCNLERANQVDLMVTWTDKQAADTLATWLAKITEYRNVRTAFGDVDTDVALDPTTHLILDAGVPRQSLIYEEAMRLIDEANEWILITCQYFPGGETARHLAAAQERGVRVEIDYSHPRAHGSFAALQRMHQLAQRGRRLPRNFFDNQLGKTSPKLHAKILASEKSAMIGSHNYVIYGVNFGTAELALRSDDPVFADSVASYIRSQIALQSPVTPMPTADTKR